MLFRSSVTGQQSVFFSAEWGSETIATDQETFGASMTLNGVYSWSGDVNDHGRRAYAHNPVEPAFLLEEPYDEEGPDGNGYNPNATQPVRRFQWWGWLSTIGGYISGNGYVWSFLAPDWRDHLDTQGSRDMALLNAFMGSIAWYNLVPSGLNGMRTLIPAGGSDESSSDYVAAAATADGTLLVAYVPPAHSGPITVDMGVLNGPARALWFDPTSGAYDGIGAGLTNAGSRAFTTPGNNSVGAKDWVLVLDYTDGIPAAAPTISSLPDQSTAVNTPTLPIPFTINDADTPVGNLTLSAGSSNPTLVPTNNIVFGGSGANWTVTVSPAINQLGTVTLTVSVSDGTHTTSDSFVLTVARHALSVVADNATRLYGQTNPVFTGTLSGVQDGDNITATYSSAATADSLPGDYEIVPTLIDPDGRLVNYTVAVTNGILTIVDAPHLLSISEPTPGAFVIECRVQAGRTYRFQYKNSLLDDVWLSLGADQTATSSRVAITNDANADLQRFYRLLDVTAP